MFKNLLNHVWRKPQPVQPIPLQSEPVMKVADVRKMLTGLENHFVLNVGRQRCETCKTETLHCQKLTLADTDVCVCPRKDIKGFRRPKKEPKSE